MIELVAEMQSSIVVEHLTHYPKVMDLSPARVAELGEKKLQC
jgi:hypothetical protein